MKIIDTKQNKTFFCVMLGVIVLFILFSVVLLYLKISDTGVYIFISALCMSLVFLGGWLWYCRVQNKIIETAAEKIKAYTSGDRNARIECEDEGELYKLFHEVNSLVTILNAHAENELLAKQFLKNTISDISHQLKTPLTALNIYNGLMQNEVKNYPDMKKLTDLTDQELDRIETLVQSLLKVTKFDSKTVVLNKSTENVAQMMTRVKNHFDFRAKQEGKEIILKGDDSIFLHCDRDWILEAVDNIVKNALDHTKQGNTIHIEWKQIASVVQIVIKDNGNGIHPEDLPHIFKRFYRSRFSQDKQGIGLGLPLAKSIVEAHNGTIEVDSELGIYTVFTINFLIPTKL
jgi:signal transduction histidine kinase